MEDRRSSDVDGIIVQPGDVGDEEQEAETLEDQGGSFRTQRLRVLMLMNIMCRQIQTCP